MHRYRGFILLGLIALMTLLGAIIYTRSQGNRNTTTVAASPPLPVLTRAAVVAVRDLFWGTALTADMLKLETFPEKNLPQGYFSNLESVEGRFLVSNLAANEFILESKLARRGLEPAMQKEKRAMAVKVNNIVGVAGYIKPGNRVDVLVILRPSKQWPATTKIALQNLLVLATGAEIQRENEEKKAAAVDVITLEVTPMEAEKLALASSQGDLRLALRNSRDDEAVLTTGATVPALLSSYRSPEARRRGQTVEVIKGGDVKTLTFR